MGTLGKMLCCGTHGVRGGYCAKHDRSSRPGGEQVFLSGGADGECKPPGRPGAGGIATGGRKICRARRKKAAAGGRRYQRRPALWGSIARTLLPSGCMVSAHCRKHDSMSKGGAVAGAPCFAEKKTILILVEPRTKKDSRRYPQVLAVFSGAGEGT